PCGEFASPRRPTISGSLQSWPSALPHSAAAISCAGSPRANLSLSRRVPSETSVLSENPPYCSEARLQANARACPVAGFFYNFTHRRCPRILSRLDVPFREHPLLSL